MNFLELQCNFHNAAEPKERQHKLLINQHDFVSFDFKFPLHMSAACCDLSVNLSKVYNKS